MSLEMCIIFGLLALVVGLGVIALILYWVWQHEKDSGDKKVREKLQKERGVYLQEFLAAQSDMQNFVARYFIDDDKIKKVLREEIDSITSKSIQNLAKELGVKIVEMTGKDDKRPW